MASFNYYAKSIYAISIILICCLSSSLCKQQLSNDVICENSLKNCDENGNIIVSRKKRALTFPEGSSLQLGMTIDQILSEIVRFKSILHSFQLN